MSFGAVLPLTGLAGWKLLQKTEARQTEIMARQPSRLREAEYFRQNIGKISSAQDLVADRRLLAVSLGAFGLQDDLPNRAFIEKVLSGGTLDPKALANKLADKRYAKLSAAFGFDLTPPKTKLSTFPDRILANWTAQGFERSVGDQDENLRLAMNARRELAELARSTMTEGTKWYTVLGQPPLRAVFEAAFGLPTAFARIPIERQKEIFEEKAATALGDKTVSQFADPRKVENLLTKFLVRSDLKSFSMGPSKAQTALMLLQGMNISR